MKGGTWSTPIDLTQGTSMEGYTGQVAVMDSAGDIHVLINPGDGKYVHVRTKNGAWLPHLPTGWQASDWIEMAVAEGNTLVVVYWMGGTPTHPIWSWMRPGSLPCRSWPLKAMQLTQTAGVAFIHCDCCSHLGIDTHCDTQRAVFSDWPRRQREFQPVAGRAAWHFSAVVIVLGVVLFQLRRRRR